VTRAWLALALLLAGPAEPGREVVAWLHGEPLYRDQVTSPVAFRIYRHQVDIHSLLVQEIERQVDARLLAREAERRGVGVEALLAEAATGAPPVEEADVDRYLAERPQEAAVPEARARVRHYLEETRRIERRLGLLGALRERAGYRLVLEPPVPPRTAIGLEGAALRGPADAPIEIVHFASFGSRASARSAARLARLAQELPGAFRQAHRDFLGRPDETALLAARLGQLARRAGSFWSLHDALFALDGRLDEAALARAAESAGLGGDALAQARGDASLLAAVRRDQDAGVAAGVPREPTLFVNGRYASGLQPYGELRALVLEELRAARGPGAGEGPAQGVDPAASGRPE